jgi:transcriptional antiterminator NusG
MTVDETPREIDSADEGAPEPRSEVLTDEPPAPEREPEGAEAAPTPPGGDATISALEGAEPPEAAEAPDAEPEALAEAEPQPEPESPAQPEEPEAEEAPPAVEEAPPEVEEAPPGAEEPSAEVEEPSPEPEEAPPAAKKAPAAAKKAPPAKEPQPEEAPPPSDDPFGGSGDWYVIHTYAGYENKVKNNLASRIKTMQKQDKIFDVVIPMEDVMEIKGGRKQVVQKKVFPGYLLVKMIYEDDSWYVVRNTPGVTGFVSSGTGQKPTPLSRREVEKILAVKKEETKPQFRLEFEEDDVVRIISGPFADFTGTISEINVDQSKVKVMVNIFDRETPVELGFDQVTKA